MIMPAKISIAFYTLQSNFKRKSLYTVAQFEMKVWAQEIKKLSSAYTPIK